jgi:hypothetical protein
MKYKILHGLLFLFIGLCTYAQNGVTVYGYSQDILPGNVPVSTGEKKTNKAVVHTDYFIYISGPAKKTLHPIEMWINGEPFSIKTETTGSTPVQINVGNRNTTLVPKTKNKVQRLTPWPYMPGKSFAKAKEKAASNELVVVYKLNGKFYSAVLKKITRLEPQANE